jgi:hypothetical protein
MSIRWNKIQECYLQEAGLESNATRADIWSQRVISKIWELWFDLWELRNSFHHGKSTEEKHKRLSEKVKRELVFLYSFQNRVQYQNRDVFRSTVEEHTAEPLARQQLWVKMFRSLILSSAKRLESETTEDIRLFFPPLVQ